MDDMRQISCPMCGRSVTIGEDGPVPCPSCGIPVSAPAAAEPPAPPTPTEDDSATRIATLRPSEPAPAEAPPAVIATTMPAVEQPASPSTSVSPVSDTIDPSTQPVSEEAVQQAAYPPATPPPAVEQSAPAAAPAPEQPVTQTYHATQQQPETQAYAYTPPQQPLTQPYAPAVPPTPQQAPKRNPALVIVGVVVAVVLLLGIVSAAVVFANRAGVLQPPAQATLTPTPAATATATIPAGFTQFTDEGNVYKLNYPSEWKKTAESGSFSLTIFTGTGQAARQVFEVEYYKIKIDPKTVQEQFFQALGATGKVSNNQGPTEVPLAGETWQQNTADITTSGVQLHVVSLATNHGQYTVLIAYLASTDTFDSADTQAFQPMLNSFQFVQ